MSSCLDVTEAMVTEALAPARSLVDVPPRERVFALIERMAEVAEPRRGAPKILFVLARVSRCSWLEGDLEIRLSARDGGTLLETFVNDGLSLLRLRPPVKLRAPYEEFRRAVMQRPELVAPLTVCGDVGGTTMRLSAPEATGAADEAPPLETRADVPRAPSKRERRSPAVPKDESSAVVAKIPLKRVLVAAGDSGHKARIKRSPSEKMVVPRRPTAVPPDERVVRRDSERTATGRSRTGSGRRSTTPPGPGKPPRDPGSGRRT